MSVLDWDASQEAVNARRCLGEQRLPFVCWVESVGEHCLARLWNCVSMQGWICQHWAVAVDPNLGAY